MCASCCVDTQRKNKWNLLQPCLCSGLHCAISMYCLFDKLIFILGWLVYQAGSAVKWWCDKKKIFCRENILSLACLAEFHDLFSKQSCRTLGTFRDRELYAYVSPTHLKDFGNSSMWSDSTSGLGTRWSRIKKRRFTVLHNLQVWN